MKDDVIYRQAAIEALGERPMVWTDDDQYTLGERNQYDTDKLAIETLPSVQPILQEYSVWFRIGETLVDVGKMHITAEEGIEKIRNYLIRMKKPERRKKGKWIRITQGATLEKYMCPFCHRIIESYGAEELLLMRYPFCHCGADMRGEENE